MSSAIGLIGSGFAVLTIVASAVAFYDVDRRGASQKMLAAVPLPRIPSFSISDEQKLLKYSKGMQKAIVAQQVAIDADALNIIGYTEPLVELDDAEDDHPAYHVAMVYRSGRHKYALIDEVMYQLGDELPWGEKITDVNLDGVTVEKDGETTNLPIRSYATKPILGQPKSVYVNGANAQDYEQAMENHRQMAEATDALRVIRRAR